MEEEWSTFRGQHLRVVREASLQRAIYKYQRPLHHRTTHSTRRNLQAALTMQPRFEHSRNERADSSSSSSSRKSKSFHTNVQERAAASFQGASTAPHPVLPWVVYPKTYLMCLGNQGGMGFPLTSCLPVQSASDGAVVLVVVKWRLLLLF